MPGKQAFFQIVNAKNFEQTATQRLRERDNEAYMCDPSLDLQSHAISDPARGSSSVALKTMLF